MRVTFEDQVVNSLPKLTTAFRCVNNIWTRAESPSGREFLPKKLTIITWNMNAKAPFKNQRLLGVLRHIKEKKFLDANPPPASCILLQEVHAAALPTILACPWVRENYLITPISSHGWKSSFGLVTLVSKDVPVSTVFTMKLPMTSLGRQALFTDLHISVSTPKESSSSGPNGRIARTIRIANAHLESGTSDIDLRSREKQLYKIGQMLNGINIDVFICAGSLCSITEIDKISIARAGFTDVWRRRRDPETWGHRSGKHGLPAGRLDKILYFPTPGVKFSSEACVGVTLKCEVPTGTSSPVFVSDHTGVSTDLIILDTHRTV
ncbi:Endonuclease/exonuclease/phosphatase [Hysterangium stoloniferum]|nr:Endonuclease/exonuclease/phosphatase [Hysterangium stoloniferum]